jgi:hypothetical protein
MSYIIPNVVERDARGERAWDIYSRSNLNESRQPSPYSGVNFWTMNNGLYG